MLLAPCMQKKQEPEYARQLKRVQQKRTHESTLAKKGIIYVRSYAMLHRGLTTYRNNQARSSLHQSFQGIYITFIQTISCDHAMNGSYIEACLCRPMMHFPEK